MPFELKPSEFFLGQIGRLSKKAKQLLEDKLLQVKENPFHCKRIFGFKLFLFRIRFSDNKTEKRVVYLIDGGFIKLICILDRKNNYKDLKKYLKKLGYL